MKVHAISSGGTRLLNQELTTQLIEFLSNELEDGESVSFIHASKTRQSANANLNMIREYANRDLK